MISLDEMMETMMSDNYLVLANTEIESLSYPVPLIVSDIRVEAFFLNWNTSSPFKDRPHAWLYIDSNSGKLIQYSDCRINDFASELCIPIGTEINYGAPSRVDHRELLKLKRKFINAYSFVRTFSFSEKLNENEITYAKEYYILINQIINQELLRFYQALSPSFFCWLSRVIVE